MRHEKQSRGAVLIESAIMIPVLLLLILGGVGVLDLVYTRSVIHFTVQEAARLAQDDDNLRADVYTLSSNPAAAQAYQAARESLIRRALATMSTRSLTGVNLEKVSMHGPIGGSGLSLAIIPPNFSARVDGWDQVAHHAAKCELTTLKSDVPQAKPASICSGTGSRADLREYPTEIHAYANLKSPFFGTVKSDIVTKVYLTPRAPNLVTSVEVPKKELTPSGNVVGGYVLSFKWFTRRGHTQAGSSTVQMMGYSGHKGWGKITVHTKDKVSVPACQPGLNTLYLPTQELFTGGYIAQIRQTDGVWQDALSTIPPPNGDSAPPFAQFLCLTP